ncbi:protein FAM227A [Lepisosteus oculatus]|uniref:Family with sequence similarity 227 member A n=1 Tax=Lepisosteus oculatus TaxID=7918 RepID=W5MET6_LEPOC|nr:PREDICTED: protein FAM227A [Lepisosteus oculatus]
MADINRLCSPVAVYEEDVKENPVTAQRKRESQQEATRSPVSCLVGTIGKLNKKITHLQLDLQQYGKRPVTFNGYERPKGQMGFTPESEVNEKVRCQVLKCKERDEKDLQEISHVSPEHPSHSLQLDRQHKGNSCLEKMEKDKPKLVELHQYPGFSNEMPTLLPNNITLDTIISRVMKAQSHLARKHRCQAEFRSLLALPVMEYFLLDSFWFIFLQTYQPEQDSQDQLFSRLSENYIQLLTHCLFSRYGDIFLKEFPSTLCQILYCCFCCCFPQSCSTFHCDTFLSQLCNTAYQWIGGTRPTPGVFSQWDFSSLEPEEARKVELMSGSDKNKKTKGSSLSFLDAYSSSSCVPCLPSCSRHPSFTAARFKSRSSPFSASIPSLASVHSKGLQETRSYVSITADPADVQNKKVGAELMVFSSEADGTYYHPRRESHPACPGPYFKRCTFNLWGHSPLMQFYLQRRQADTQAGLDFLVQRSEIHQLPPADSSTYWEIVCQAHQQIQAQRRVIGALRSQQARDLASMHRKQLSERHELFRKEKKLLSCKRTVKRMCQLLVPDKKMNEPVKTKSEVTQAFEAALLAQD